MSVNVYGGFDQASLDREYNARATVPDFPAEMAKYETESRAAMAALRREADIVFDAASGEKLDLYPAAAGGPLFVYIHGGYWRALSKETSAFVAPGLVAAGIHVAVVDYTLRPHATLDEMVRQCRAAIAWLYRNAAQFGYDAGRIHVGGSSAGGHLSGMMLAGGWQQGFGLPEDMVKGGVLLSGLFDLEPVQLSEVNGWMDMDREMALRNSPSRLLPARGGPIITSFGGSETAEFKRQTRDFQAQWERIGPARYVAMDPCNHFDIAIALGQKGTALNEAAVAMMLTGRV